MKIDSLYKTVESFNIMHRREYKKKPADSALEEASEIVSDLDNWEEVWPSLIEKVASSRIELRVSALQSMNKILTARYIEYSEIEPFLEDTLNCLHNPIMSRASREEHDEALTVLCNLSLNTFAEFEPYVHIFLDDIIPTLPDMTEEESFRFFAIAFVVSISVSHQDLCMKVFRSLHGLMTNKKSRTTEFTEQMISSCIKSIGLLISTFPDEVVADTIYSDLTALIDLAVSNQKPLVILAAIDLIPIIYEAILTVESQNQTEEAVNAIKSKQFASKYKSKISDLGSDLSKKADQKTVKSRVKEVTDLLSNIAVRDGTLMEGASESIVLNSQEVEIFGVRNCLILSAIRRITKVHFQQQMSENLEIRDFFGFKLLTSDHALRLKKKNKGEIMKNRVQTKKEREMEINKKRRQKEGL